MAQQNFYGSNSNFNERAIFYKGIDVNGNSSVSGDLDVNGNSSVSGDLDVNGNSSVSGDLDVNGRMEINNERAFFYKGINVDGFSSFFGNLDVNGNFSVSGAFGCAGDITVETSPFINMIPTISSDYTVTTAYNSMSVGPVTINSGVTVTVESGATWTIV